MSNLPKFYANSIGTVIFVDTKNEISTATVLQLRVRKPSGKEVTWVGVLGPMNEFGKYTVIKYVIQSGDWDESGWYTLQAYIEIASWSGTGDAVKFQIFPEFK